MKLIFSFWSYSPLSIANNIMTNAQSKLSPHASRELSPVELMTMLPGVGNLNYHCRNPKGQRKKMLRKIKAQLTMMSWSDGQLSTQLTLDRTKQNEEYTFKLPS